MDFNWPKKTFYWLTKSGAWSVKIYAGFLVCACLLNCGCESDRDGDVSQTSNPSTSGDSGDSDSAVKKTAATGSKKTAPNIPSNQPKPVEPDVNDAQFHAAIEAAAKEYLQFAIINNVPFSVKPKQAQSGLDIDFELPAPKLAPEACAAVALDITLVPEEPGARMSQADSESGHGQKLYFLFAKDSGHYLNPDGSDSPVGQVLVKESWTAVPGNAGAKNLRNHASGNRVNPRVTVDGETLKLGKRKDLFVMLKQDLETEATDDGWVYGVIDPESYKIKAAGAVASCVACHEGEKDRLFRDGVIDWNAKAKKLSADSGEALPKPADPKDDE